MSGGGGMRRVSRHTMVYGLGIMLGKAVALIMLPFYTNYLTPADYGVMQLVEMTLDIVSIVAGSQIAQGVFRYYHKAETPEQRQAVVSTALLLLVTTFGVAATATALAAPALCRLVFGTEEYANLVRLAAASLGIQALVIVPFAYLRLRERSVLFTLVNTAKLALQVSLNIYFLAGLNMGLEGVFTSTVIANAALGGLLSLYLIREVGTRFQAEFARSLVRYGLPLVLTQALTFFSTFGDRYFLRVYGGVSDVGLYSLAYQFGFILATVGYVPFAMMWEPMRFEVARRADRDHVYARAFVHSNLLLLTVAAGTGLFVDDFIRIMADANFHSASRLVPVILVAFVFQSWAGFMETGILVKERTGNITLANGLAALTALAGFALLIPKWLAVGAALATVASFGTRFLVTYRLSQQLFPIRYEWKPVHKLAGAAFFVCLAATLIPKLPLVWSVPIHVLLFVLYLLAAWTLNILSADDRAWIHQMLGAVRLRLVASSEDRPEAGGRPEA